MQTPEQIIESLKPYDETLTKIWDKAYEAFHEKIIVLDDDPTGVQTVHGVPVFTDWSLETIRELFLEPRQLAFILTNSRAFSKEETIQVHTEIAVNIAQIAKELKKDFVLISRSDSTLRGHYPLETETLKYVLEEEETAIYDGEILVPFFKEGGRETIQNIHYVKQGNQYVPAAETEFANDRMFGFTQSDLTKYIEEKTKGAYKAENVTAITLQELRDLNIESITLKLEKVEDFQKVIVNAYTEEDLKVFCIALFEAIKAGKQFLFRTAASFTKVIGNISSKPLLTKEQLINQNSHNGGIVVVGSHVQKTTSQLNSLMEVKELQFIEFNCSLVTDTELFKDEIQRIQQQINTSIANGKSVCVYTSRELIKLDNDDREAELAMSVTIANGLTSFVQNCSPEPRFVVAKGGITSSDVGTKGLAVKKAEVLGQVAPGVPVWQTDEGSTFPHIPYIIFPGNVGEVDTLKNIVENLL